MQTIALSIVIIAGLWLIGVSILMAAHPRYCLRLFARMTRTLQAADWRVQLVEQGLRLLVGFALIVRSPVSKAPLAFDIAGWLLVATSLLILVAPIRWHGAYGAWWADRLSAPIVRLLSPVPAIGGATLIYAAV